MTSIENMLLTPFENLKIMDELDNEYNILLKNIEILKNNKNYTKGTAVKLHNKNLQYKKDIIFKVFDSDQNEIINQLRKCLEFNPRTDHILY